MTNKTPAGMVDALSATGEVLIPLVLLKSKQENSQNFIGFIPGFVMKNCVESSEELCKEKLKQYLIKLSTTKKFYLNMIVY